MSQEFPINVFPDVERNAFNKYTKKNVTEDYIYENLELKGWKCYKPFVDTGIDLIATKKDENGKQLYRYIQVKTRELIGNCFGYTLKPKDFRIDPRHYFLFFCDTVNDIILLSMYDYMKLFYVNQEMGVTHFANPTFRTNNNKLNSLKYNESTGWTWAYRSAEGIKVVDFNNYVNLNGVARMENNYIDEHLDELKKEIADMKFEMFYKINKTQKNAPLFEPGIKEIVEQNMDDMKSYNPEVYVQDINGINHKYQNDYPELYASHKRYIYGCFEDEGGENNG